MPIATVTARSVRLGLRATPEQETVLRRAAVVAHKSLTDFILDATYQTHRIKTGHYLNLMARDGINQGRRCLTLSSDYFQLRFNFLWEAAQSRK
jgi:hypothetical protein